MPYIDPKDRPKMDKVVDFMIKNNVTPNGKLNYVLYSFCKRTVNPSYNNYKNYRAELNECANEIKRRMMDEYENQKIIQNGDVE
jgi:hypothetical protein